MLIKNRSVIAFLLLIFIMLSVIAGCSDKKKDAAAETTTASGEQSEDETTELKPNLPGDTFDGYEYKILMKGSDYIEWASQDIDVEELNGEVINDAVYNRNLYVEDTYNVKLTGIEGRTSMGADIRKTVSADEYAYDFVTANMYDTSSLATQGALVDLKTVPWLDLSAPWWDQRANSDLSINHRLYMTVGDLLIMPNDATWLVLFNKQLIINYNLTSPYELVGKNEWNFDTMFTMASGISNDLNGDGKMDENDIYGQISQYENGVGFLLGFDIKVISKDDDDLPYISVNTEKTATSWERIEDFIMNREYSINFQDSDLAKYNRPFETTQAMFEDNRGLFKTTAIQLVIRMRNMETDFGIVPMPKYNSAQETYFNFVHPTASCVSIPKTNNELERTGVILEALAAKSRYTVRSAYYEISLNYKYLRDEESIVMLDLVLETRIFDISQIYNWGGLGSLFPSMLSKKSTNFVSEFTKIEKSATKAMQKTIDSYLAVE